MDEEIMFSDDIIEESNPVEEVSYQERVKIENYIGKANIMKDIKEEKIQEIYNRCNEGYNLDYEIRQARNDVLIEANKSAMQVLDPKNSPWKNCANVKLPLITTGAIDFASKIYPAVIQDDTVVRCKTIGNDSAIKIERMEAGERLSSFLNWELMEKMPNWKDDEDMLTYALPVNGIMIKKIYYDVVENTFRSDLIFPENFFTPNDTRDLETAERITHVYQMSTEDIISSLRMGVFAGFDVEDLKKENIFLDNGDGGVDNNIVRDEDKIQEEGNSNVWTVCEQHCWIDLDEDGYREPYIVTFIPKLEKVVRIIARYDQDSIILNEDNEIIRIKPIPFFVKYSFLPSPDGSFYSLGLGELLLPINEAANTVTNQLLDAGTLNNLPAGLISKSAKLTAGDMSFQPGEFKQVNSFLGKIQDNVMLLPTKEPSGTLFELLKSLVESANSIASVKDLTNTDFPSNSSVITTLSIIENGMSPFKAIYKRFHSALTKEIKMLAYWMKKYANFDDYIRVTGDKKASEADFEALDIVIPVSDPSLVTSTQKMGRAQFLESLLQNPTFDTAKVSMEMVSLMGIDPMPLLAQPPAPDPFVEETKKAQLENLIAQTQEILSRIRKNDTQSKAEVIRANSEDTKRTADSILALANAESKEAGIQNDMFINELKRAKESVSSYVEDKTDVEEISQPELPEGK